MPMRKGLLPREGLKADALVRLTGATALNPLVTLPLLLLARLTRRGRDLAVLHPTALARLRLLFLAGLARRLGAWYSDRVLNNWADDPSWNWGKGEGGGGSGGRGGEVVLVTGGSGGIGGHVVRLLAETGVPVVVLDIQPLTFEAASNVHYFRCDITNPKEIAAVAAEVRAQVGHPTVLINNAGVARGKSILDSSEKDVRFTFDVNALAHYWVVKEYLPSLVENNHGMVVTVASIASWVTVPNMVDYAATKAAALAFHEGLTAELATRYGAPRVRTVVVNQGYTRTPLFEGYHNSKGFLMPTLEPETVAEAVARQVLSGRSGQVILPSLAAGLTALAAMPHWLQHGMRRDGAEIMPNWAGRQVVPDLDRFYDARERDVEGSTVLVPEGSK